MPLRSRIIRYASAAILVGAITFGIIKFSDKPATSSVEQNIAVLDPSIEKGRQMNDTEFNQALENLTTTDITNYLEKNGDITDVAALGNNLDEKDLPSQDDYLMDEKTLENYLDKIDLTTLNN